MEFQYYYMVTLRSINRVRYVTDDELTTSLWCAILHNYSKVDLNFVDITFELDPKWKQLHAHAIIGTDTKLVYRRSLTSYRGIRIYYKEIGNLSGACRYIHKNSGQCHLVINRFGHESYFFINNGEVAPSPPLGGTRNDGYKKI